MSPQGTNFHSKYKLRANGKSLSLKSPVVMGILNVTPDSFYDGGSIATHEDLLKKADHHLSAGAAILDLGAVSTRPGAPDIDEDTELRRLIPALKLLRDSFPKAWISVDTYHSVVALEAAECGADIINDISGGTFDAQMFAAVASAKLPYVLMHTPARPDAMQKNPRYGNVTRDVSGFLKKRIALAKKAGVKQVIADPGFGFGKTLRHNYSLLKHLGELQKLGCPLLIGVSRKGMISRPLGLTAAEALNGTTVAHTIALLNGANILRVHDVREAREAITLVQQLQ